MFCSGGVADFRAKLNSAEKQAHCLGGMLESKVLQEQNLKEECPHAAHLGLLLDEDLKVLVDDGHSQQDSGSGSKINKVLVYRID